METIDFLEILATHSHHQINLSGLIHKLPIEVKSAYLANDSEALKAYLSHGSYLANESHITQI